MNQNSNKKNAKNSGDDNLVHEDNNYTEDIHNINDDNDDRNSQNNFDLSQKYDEVSEYHELNILKEPIVQKPTMKMGGSSPKSWISEPMNERNMISMKQENEEEKQMHNLNVYDPDSYK